MNRRSFLGGAGISLAGGYILLLQPAADEIQTLQAEVNDLDARVDALETQVAGLGGGSSSVSSNTSVSSTNKTHTIQLNGSGTLVTDPYTLSKGRYRVNVGVAPSEGFYSFTLEVQDPDGNTELVIDESGESSGDWRGSAMYEASAEGDYIFSVSNTSGSWSIAFELL